MPRREILTPTERLQLLAFPYDKGELIRVLTLSKADADRDQPHALLQIWASTSSPTVVSLYSGIRCLTAGLLQIW